MIAALAALNHLATPRARAHITALRVLLEGRVDLLLAVRLAVVGLRRVVQERIRGAKACRAGGGCKQARTMLQTKH